MQKVLAERLFPRQGSRVGWLADAALILLASLFIALLAQAAVYLPFSPVPITGQTLGVLLVGMALGARRGALALAAYLGEGLLGLPVFAAGASGPAYMLGPTGGYLLGFVAAAWLVGALAERGFDRHLSKTLVAFALGNAVIYLFGVAWLSTLLGIQAAVQAGVVPFLIGDALKALLAALLLPGAWKLLGQREQE